MRGDAVVGPRHYLDEGRQPGGADPPGAGIHNAGVGQELTQVNVTVPFWARYWSGAGATTALSATCTHTAVDPAPPPPPPPWVPSGVVTPAFAPKPPWN